MRRRSCYYGSAGRISVLPPPTMRSPHSAFSIVSARERHVFWTTMPSRTFLLALVADALVGTVLTFVGLPGLTPLPWWQTLAIFVYALVACLGVNDVVKVVMIRWRVHDAVEESAQNPP